MNKKIKIVLIVAALFIFIGAVIAVVLFSQKKQNQEIAEQLSQTIIENNESVPDDVKTTESITCGGKNYNAEIYNLEGVDVAKRIVQLLGKNCKLNAAGANIGIDILNGDKPRSYTVTLYNKEDKSSGNMFVIYLDENTVVAVVDEFRGNTKVIGTFK